MAHARVHHHPHSGQTHYHGPANFGADFGPNFGAKVGRAFAIGISLNLCFAGIGVAINALTAMLFLRGQEDLNIRGAYLHMAADALVLLGMVVMLTGFTRIDPLASLMIVAVIAWGTRGLAARIDLTEVKQHLASLDGVTAVHDFHFWPMSITEPSLTAHLVMPARPASDSFLRDIAGSLAGRFAAGHAALRTESGEHPCRQGCR